MPARYGALTLALIALLAAAAFGEPTPVAALHNGAAGCAGGGGDAPPSFVQRPSVDPATNPAATRALGGPRSLAYHLARAWYFDQRAEEFAAMGEFRAAIAAGVAIPQVRVDSLARLPLSLRLYRSGDLAAAREQWQIVLGDASAYAEGGGLARGWDPWFNAVGAGAHVEEGLALARSGDDRAAERAWRLALRCAGNVPFPPPHVLLGDAASRHGDLDTARREWLAALDVETDGPISSYQETALRRLLSSAPSP